LFWVTNRTNPDSIPADWGILLVEHGKAVHAYVNPDLGKCWDQQYKGGKWVMGEVFAEVDKLLDHGKKERPVDTKEGDKKAKVEPLVKDVPKEKP